ncbi:MAG: hypothetical protein K6E32_09800 [Lachnospiraceae bacterium]|nr:hypothetical protein [Lachnospiraceae bacterium]
MKRIYFLFVFAVLSTMLLAGCGHEHDFQIVSCDAPLTCAICGKTEGEAVGHDFSKATCTEPAKCTRCGETQGEALGHDFSEATCTEPAKCKRCGETQGEALGHSFTEANYQDAAVCTVCGTTEGSPLTPGFEAHGLKINATLDTDYPYVTDTYDGEADTVGTARISDFKICRNDGRLPEKDGYVWLSIHMAVEFTDDAAWMHGYRPGICLEDYYDIELHDDTFRNYEGYGLPEAYRDFTNLTNYSTYNVNFHGIDYECERFTVPNEDNGWMGDHLARSGFTYYFHVPKGYDGTVAGFYHYDFAHPWDAGLYIYDMADDNSLFYKLDPALASND